MSRRIGAALGLPVLIGALALAGCSQRPEPTVMPPTGPSPTEGATAYDPEVEPSRAVLPLVPESATQLRITDFAQTKLHLAVPDLSSAASAEERSRFWALATRRTAMLSDGLLRDVTRELERGFGWSQLDVDWEAQFTGPDGDGWVIKVRDELPMGDVSRAADAGIGPLADGTVLPELHLIVHNTAEDGAPSWGDHQEVADVVGAPGVSTYVARECLPFDSVYGPQVLQVLAEGPRRDLARLERLEVWSVTFGGELATARVGRERDDLFTRMQLAEHLPETEPEFGGAFRRGVGDAVRGRIGWTLGDPRSAVELVERGRLPFALCPE